MQLLKSVFVFVLLAVTAPVFAHSVVSPSQTATSKYENFSLGVPTERDVPTIGMRLVVPAELDRVAPFVKPGWKISVKKDSAGKVTELLWTGGSIPAGQKDVFQFTARTPATSTTLIWKAYQTYEGGEVVGWDQDPKGKPEKEGEHVSNPYSMTEVQSVSTVETTDSTQRTDRLPLILSVSALLVAALALVRRR